VGVKALHNWLKNTYNAAPYSGNYEAKTSPALPTKFNLSVGDIINLGVKGVNEWEHSVIVTKITSNTPSGILVTAHDYEREDWALSNYFTSGKMDLVYYHHMSHSGIGALDYADIISYTDPVYRGNDCLSPTLYSSYPGGSGCYFGRFRDSDGSGSKPTRWDWKIVFYHSNGIPYTLTSLTNTGTGTWDTTYKMYTNSYSVNIGTLPSGYNWDRDANNRVIGACILQCLDSDWYNHIVTYPIAYSVPITTAPTLTTPSNNAVEIPQNPVFKWNAVSGSTSYHIQVARDQQFGTIVIDEPGFPATTYYCDPLLPNTKYYWRVCGNNQYGQGIYSSVWSFTTSSFPVDLIVANQNITSSNSLPLAKAHNSISVANSRFYQGATTSLNAGNVIYVGDGTTLDDGSNINLVVDPNLR
jgi:hypothetical protein